MRFLADENVPLASVLRLREAGHRVRAIAEECPGVTDREVLSQARDEGRIVLTFDSDYGTLIYQRGLTAPAGVIYFRLLPSTPDEAAMRVLELFNAPGFEFEGRFTVVEADRVRQRPLP